MSITPRFLLVLAISVVFSGCQLNPFQKPTPEPTIQPTIAEPSPTIQPLTPTTPEGEVINMLITENNFTTDEILGVKNEPLTLMIRNQLQVPIAVVIDELRVNSGPIQFGELREISIPTNQPGEFTMYSNLGSQRAQGFEAVVIIE